MERQLRAWAISEKTVLRGHPVSLYWNPDSLGGPALGADDEDAFFLFFFFFLSLPFPMTFVLQLLAEWPCTLSCYWKNLVRSEKVALTACKPSDSWQSCTNSSTVQSLLHVPGKTM